jgi:hypothetical protein
MYLVNVQSLILRVKVTISKAKCCDGLWTPFGCCARFGI